MQLLAFCLGPSQITGNKDAPALLADCRIVQSAACVTRCASKNFEWFCLLVFVEEKLENDQ